VLRGGSGADLISDVFLAPDDGLRDIFFLEAGLGMDTVGGFTQGTDLLWLPETQFGDLDYNASGVLAGGQIRNSANPAATIAAAQLIFETDTKILWYDADGTGAGASVQIANILTPATILKSDFLIVSEI
jgi:hypothetical protein